METNKQYKRVPFDIELAKRIQSGEVEGKIVTRDGYSARIICDNVNSSYPLICAISFEPNNEKVFCYRLDGSYHYECCEHDLFIELPEETLKPESTSKYMDETIRNFSYHEREIFEFGDTRLSSEDLDNLYGE